MRVLLISPDRKDVVAERAQGARRIKATFPPLSLLQVAALTPPDVDIQVVDEAVEDVDFDVSPDLVGITAFTSSAPRAYEIASTFRRRGIPVVLGGMHVSACPEEALRYCDAVVVGEAEGQWEQLLGDLQSGRMKRVYRTDGYPDLSDCPRPRREFIRRRDYLAPDTVQATRGCAHACSFCSVSIFFGRRIRSRPVDSVAAEVESLPGHYVIFVDDNIMTAPGYARQLFERLRGTGKKWMGQASTAVLENAELIRLAARSGCRALFVGLETLSESTLMKVDKGFNVVGRFKDLIARLHDAGIGVVGAFMFGFDGEDESVFERTAEFADGTHIDLPQYSILTPLPGTPLYAQMEAEGRIIDRDWSHYDGGHVVFSPRGTTPEKLAKGLRDALQHSYSRLGIVRRLFGISARLPAMVALNLAFRRRAIPWATRTPR
ncbi:MAG: B12-binding domain-containing radical SAM protein [Armatimonadetes bacterium]|nr:B12-binding domain-containing radical SAM protein [Armatimonadota bacterium]